MNGAFAYLTSSPFLFQKIIGLTPIQYGYLSLAFGFIVLVLSLANIQFLKYFKISTLINIGVSAIILGGGLLILFHFLGILTLWSLYGPCILFFASIAILRTNSIAKSIAQVSRNFGAANAILFSMQMSLGALSSFVFSFFKQTNGLSLGNYFFVLGLIALLLVFWAKKAEVQREKELKKHRAH